MKSFDFELPDENGNIHRLSDQMGKWVVVYFYPKDDTPGCTAEACSFRDLLADLKSIGTVVWGISKDSPASHKKFKQKYHLTFPLLSDQDSQVIKKYNAWSVKRFMGKEFEGTKRMTYLINPKGEIEKVYENVNPLGHARQILTDIVQSQAMN